jgi:replication-associated recombination protein RarA
MLLIGAPDKLWRRLACIAFEDIGLGDLDTVALATAAMSGKRFRSELGGEWTTASFFVSHMSDATKCRAADDLLVAAETILTSRMSG